MNLKDNPKAAFLLVNDIQMPHVNHNQMHVNTVRENFDGFSRKQVEGATAAHHLMGMVATPSPRDCEGMVRLIMLKNCPITNDDIKMLTQYLSQISLQSEARRLGIALNRSLWIM